MLEDSKSKFACPASLPPVPVFRLSSNVEHSGAAVVVYALARDPITFYVCRSFLDSFKNLQPTVCSNLFFPVVTQRHPAKALSVRNKPGYPGFVV